MKMTDLSSPKIVVNRKWKMKIMKAIPMMSNMKTNSSNTNWRSIEIAYLIRTVHSDLTQS